ncbi:beta strand repeat-containing protein [Mucilaginibacter psychrotolerans]|uniref:T9SS type A sorting domain-containing protein n=1 Tax=Mucilaginibacter psychrotolerans TaxID=1524096 RepID=A0A4Y8SG44_9SPHI|nr:T9SS type A sorting domain-containing protein [Mucilaginibacter psychrotolerans]TFF37356.1 T9SS type A sorting domain-containing protein [Mucilaginibacter psychrotolerans]
MAAGGTLITGNDDGISSSGATGSIQTATRLFNVAGNYTYNGDNAQSIGTGLPTTVNNLTIDNTQGATMPPASVSYTINGALSLLNGDLDMGTNDLVTGAGFTNNGTGTLHTQSISSAPLTAGKTWNIPVDYNSSTAQTAVTGTYSDLLFSGPGVKTTSSGTISVMGNWTSSDGKIDLVTNGTTVLFNGTTQDLNDDGSDDGNGVVFKNVTFGNSGTKTLVTGTYSISNSGLLTMAGSAVLAANGNLTVTSDSLGNGNIGPIAGSADITGNVNVQTLITGGNIDINRGTRTISTPINDAALASKTFQQLQNYTLITGPGNVKNGFDLGGTSTPNAVTLQTYNEPAYTTNIYTPLPNIYQSATPGKGYLFFYRGDRSNISSKLNAPFDAPGDVTVTYTGPINKGNVTMAGLTNTHNVGDPVNGYNLLGNPCPSTIDWETVLANSSNMDNLIITIKPGGGSAQYFNGVSTNGGSRYIQTGQGFYVKVADASNTGSVNFTESSKANSSPSRLLSLPANNKQTLNAVPITTFLRMTLKDGKSSDETTVVFRDEFSETAKDDALYFSGGAVTLSTLSSDARSLAINFMPAISKVTQLKLSVNATASSKVTLLFTDISALAGAQVVLKDNFTGTITPVTQNTSYSFNIDKSNPATYGTARLILMFGTPPPPVLPFQLVSFTAQKNTTVAHLAWTAKNETNNVSFDVQRGLDSLSLTTISTVLSKRDTSLSSYSFTDNAPINGLNSYRLKQTNADGSYTYSNVLKLDFTVAAPVSLTAYPNPTTSIINISSQSIGNKVVNVAVYNTMGLTVLATRTSGANGIITYDVSQLGQGVYFVDLTDATTAAFLGHVKFIKQ